MEVKPEEAVNALTKLLNEKEKENAEPESKE